MQMMKTSTSRAFAQIDSRYRVGFMTIGIPNSGVSFPSYLPIAQYTQSQKDNWYAILFATGIFSILLKLNLLVKSQQVK
jgi:type IV pilus assembly protein PilY1